MISFKNKLLILISSVAFFTAINLTTYFTLGSKPSLDISFYMFGGLLIITFLIWVGFIYKTKKNSPPKNLTTTDKKEMQGHYKDLSFEKFQNLEQQKGRNYFHSSIFITVGNVISMAIILIMYFI